MNKMKEKRNAEVRAMEDEVHIILSSKTGISIEDICDKVDLLHKTKLKSVKYTGEPENIKEIEDLVSSWDFKGVFYRSNGYYGRQPETCFYKIRSHSYDIDHNVLVYTKIGDYVYKISSPSYDIDHNTFNIFNYIKIGDYVKESYESIDSMNKALIIHIINR